MTQESYKVNRQTTLEYKTGDHNMPTNQEDGIGNRTRAKAKTNMST